MKGIILAGGSGTRLSPSTLVISKQLLPIYDKPMIYYPLSILMLAGIKEILIISTPDHLPLFQNLFKDGKHLGLSIEYAAQEKPRGIADAFIIGEEFIGDSPVCLILGDNIFYGHHFSDNLKKAMQLKNGGMVFGYYVDDPTRYGVIEMKDGKVIGVEEKPAKPKSNYVIPGLYFFDNKCIEYAKQVEFSQRGELEITSIIERYIKNGNLEVDILGRGFAWLDTGTHENLTDASIFVKLIEDRQGLKIACLEEIAYNMGYINLDQLKETANVTAKSQYGNYLRKIVDNAEKSEKNEFAA